MMMDAFLSARPRPANDRRFLLLFLFLLASLLVYPFAETSWIGYYGFRIISVFAIVASVYAAKVHRGLLVLAIVLAIPAMLQISEVFKGEARLLYTMNTVLSFVFDVVIATVLFRRVFAGREVTWETIFGALCVYLFAGFSFTGIYEMISKFQPYAFYLDPQTNLHSVPNRFDFVYYSFGTMTSVGASGMVPVSYQVRAVSVVQTLLGVMYLAVLIARLVGSYGHSPRE